MAIPGASLVAQRTVYRADIVLREVNITRTDRLRSGIVRSSNRVGGSPSSLSGFRPVPARNVVLRIAEQEDGGHENRLQNRTKVVSGTAVTTEVISIDVRRKLGWQDTAAAP